MVLVKCVNKSGISYHNSRHRPTSRWPISRWPMSARGCPRSFPLGSLIMEDAPTALLSRFLFFDQCSVLLSLNEKIDSAGNNLKEAPRPKSPDCQQLSGLNCSEMCRATVIQQANTLIHSGTSQISLTMLTEV